MSRLVIKLSSEEDVAWCKTTTVAVNMQEFWVLGLCVIVFCDCEAILTGEKKNTLVSHKNATADQVVPQESRERSSVYGDYYPENLGLDQGYPFEEEHLHGSDHNYGHEYPHHHPVHPHYHHDSALKALLIPLAGVALLGAAAVFASNPILLQLGVVSGRRRRRAVVEGVTEQQLKDIVMLERFMSQLPREEIEREERRLLANYMTCSDGVGGKGALTCVERLACEMYHPGAPISTSELHIMDMVISEIIGNEFINEGMKKNIVRARKVGHFGGNCQVFPCYELDAKTTKVVKE